MKRQPYPGYKPSGVEWLGEVPEHWATKRLKYSAQLINEKVEGRDTDLPYIGLEHIESWTGKRIVTAEPSNSEGQSNHIRIGDVLFGKLRPYLAKVLRASEESICTGELLVLKPKCVVQDFLFYYMLSKDFISVVDSSTYGAKMPRASWEFIGNLPTLVPSQDEQSAIAAFLDRETGRIDALMEKKQQQIDLLQEKRAALISHAVTKGLAPTVKMKPSGVEWLGEIPKHWQVKRIKHIGRVKYGLGEPPDQLEDGLPFIRATDIHRGKINSEAILKVDPQDIPWSRDPELRTNDILVVRSGAYTGDSAIVPEEWAGAIAGYDMVLRVTAAVPQFVAYALLSKYLLYGQIYLERSRAAQPHLNAEELGSFIILLPPRPEQEELVSYLDSETEQGDALMEKIQYSINLLREYRTALISATVTGKLDVRGEVGIAQTQRRAPAAFQRVVLAAEIVNRLHNDPNFGRVKFEKALYLCEHHLGMDLQGNYWRQAAGPLDNRMLHSLEKQLERQNWFETQRGGQGITYVPMEKAGGHCKYFDNYWADYREGLDSLLELMWPLNTEQSEIVATLFAAWNDLIIAGAPFNEEDILREVRNNWHESKERFDEDRLHRALQWMRDKDLVPQGLGRATRT